MFFIYGKKKGKIKTYQEHQHKCSYCGAYNMSACVYEEYFHIFFIPFFPIGNKNTSIHCNECNMPFRQYVLEQEYEKKGKAPFYYYSLSIVFIGLIMLGIWYHFKSREETNIAIANPANGDVYLINIHENDKAGYYFLRVIDVAGDTVFCHHNMGIYGRYLSEMQADDYFQSDDTLRYSKATIKSMLEKEEIVSVERGYDKTSGFNNIK